MLAGWLAGVVAVIALATIVGPRFENNFGGVGQSQQVQAILQQRFPSQAGDDAQVVFRSTAPLTSPAVRSRIAAVLAGLRPLPSVSSVSPLVPAADGRIGFATIEFDAVGTKIPAADVRRVIDQARSYARPGLEVALGGAPISDVVSPSPGPSEGIGISAAIIIMLLAFGSVVAMGLPIITALTGVGVGYGVVALISHLLIDPSFGPELMAMIGLGVGIDYALFVVTRYRQGLGESLSPRDAVIRAMSTAGRAVLFAGTTVIISLLGLFLIGQQYLDGLAVGTILAVLAVMAAALTLLPAMLGFSGRAIDRLHLPGLLRAPAPGRRAGLLVAVEPDRAAPPGLVRIGRAGDPDRSCAPAVLHAPGLHGLGQRPGHPHHPAGLRPDLRGLRARVQRAAGRSPPNCPAEAPIMP